MIKLACHVCGIEVGENEAFICSDCGELTCPSCGDSDLCSECVEDEVWLADVLEFEDEW